MELGTEAAAPHLGKVLQTHQTRVRKGKSAFTASENKCGITKCDCVVTINRLIIKPCSHLTSVFAFFFDLCWQRQASSMDTIICCHRPILGSLTQTHTQTLSVNKDLCCPVTQEKLILVESK